MVAVDVELTLSAVSQRMTLTHDRLRTIVCGE